MASAKPKPVKKTHNRLFEALTVTDPTGEQVLVPINKEENNIANQFMASRMRHLLHKQIDSYREKDVTLTPKELKDLTDSAKNIAEFSGEVYAKSDPLPESGEKKVDPVVADDISFETEEKKPE